MVVRVVALVLVVRVVPARRSVLWAERSIVPVVRVAEPVAAVRVVAPELTVRVDPAKRSVVLAGRLAVPVERPEVAPGRLDVPVERLDTAVLRLSNVRLNVEPRSTVAAGRAVTPEPPLLWKSRALVIPLLRCENECSGCAVAKSLRVTPLCKS